MTDPSRSSDRGVAAHASQHSNLEHIPLHTHSRGQLSCATRGVMMVKGSHNVWLVPAGQAIWIPANLTHEVRTGGHVAMRTLYVDSAAMAKIPDFEVIKVSPLMHEAMASAMTVPAQYEPQTRDERLMEVILDELMAARRVNLNIPMPRTKKLTAICEKMIDQRAGRLVLKEIAMSENLGPTALARLFKKETGLTFGSWARRMRVLLSLFSLAEKYSVAESGRRNGYHSPSAFGAVFHEILGVTPAKYVKLLEGS